MSKIISLTGHMGSGKDTAASFLINQHGFKKLSFAGALKDAVAAIFGWDREMLEGVTEDARRARDTIDIWWSHRLGIPNLTPRWALQHFGTEVCRTHFHPEIWVASLQNQIRMLGSQPAVITDARFLNELTVLHNAGATTVRVMRGTNPAWFESAQTDEGRVQMRLRSDVHISEWDWAPWKFDVTIHNNGTIDDLGTKVSNLARDLYVRH